MEEHFHFICCCPIPSERTLFQYFISGSVVPKNNLWLCALFPCTACIRCRHVASCSHCALSMISFVCCWPSCVSCARPLCVVCANSFVCTLHGPQVFAHVVCLLLCLWFVCTSCGASRAQGRVQSMARCIFNYL